MIPLHLSPTSGKGLPAPEGVTDMTRQDTEQPRGVGLSQSCCNPQCLYRIGCAWCPSSQGHQPLFPWLSHPGGCQGTALSYFVALKISAVSFLLPLSCFQKTQYSQLSSYKQISHDCNSSEFFPKKKEHIFYFRYSNTSF